MNTAHPRLRRLTVAIAAVTLLAAAGTHSIVARAAGGAMPCSAFARNAGGSWRVLAPVMLDLGGRLYAPTVGTVLPAGAMQHGIEMSDVLDQQCGNR